MIQVFLSCDGEDCQEELVFASLKDVTEKAHEKHGWKTVPYKDRDYHYCAPCANEDN